jgi:hypothetical protein
MGEIFRVAIHHDDDCGYIEYDPATRKINVVLGDAVKRGEVEAFLSKKHVMRIAQQTLLEFKESTGFAADSLANLQIILTHLWEQTGVFVDWSRPVTDN